MGGARALVVTVVVGALLAGLAGPVQASPGDSARKPPRPVLRGNVPDPTVERVGRGYVVVSTGDLGPRVWTKRPRTRWRSGGTALRRLPTWSRPGAIWAADLHRVGRTWLLYYSAPAAGAGTYGRCIGVARARRPRGRFRPVGRAPLVCPAHMKVPRAQDPLLPRDRTLPRAGVIDPSVFRDRDGRRYLLYKTDKIPSSVRIVPLSGNGRRVRRGAVSQELFRSPGVVENPVLTRRGARLVMFTSEGDWTTCDYRTTWRASRSLTDWSAARPQVLLDHAGTGLCGPGGADLARALDGGDRIFLHGWTCRARPRPCHHDLSWRTRTRRKAVRSLYAARLVWRGGKPRVRRWARPPRG